MDLVNILKEAGYEVVEGADAVLSSIKDIRNSSSEHLCSGYRVFPDGTKCPGCRDCNKS